MKTENDILYENGAFFVMAATFGRKHTPGFQVWQNGATCATLAASIGYSGADGLNRAKAECDKRANARVS